MESYTMLFNGITLGVGVFCLYTWYKLKRPASSSKASS